MRRSRIQVKPLLNARSTRPTSDNNVRSQEASSKKENESVAKSAEGGTVSSVPVTTETNSSTSSEPKLNFRRPAFSVRPRPSIRSLSVPNLHGTQPTPILVASSSQQKETVSSGDGAESIVKESKDPVSIAVPLDIKENPVTEVNRKDSAKHISENTEDSTILPRIECFQIQDKANCKTSTENLSTNQAVAIDAAVATSLCALEDGTKETEVSMDKVTSQDVASKQMTPKTERPALQKRGRFLAQLKLNAEMASWSSASSHSSVSSSTFSSAIPPSTSTSSTPPLSTNPTPTPSTPATLSFSTTPFSTSTPSSSTTLSSITPSATSVSSSTLTTPPALTSSSKTPVESQPAVPISKVNQKTNSKMKEDNQDTFAVISKKSDTITTKTTTSSDGDHFEIPSKTKVDAEDQSSSTKPPESESSSISTSATSTLASGDDKLKDDSQINVTNKNDDATTTTIDKEVTTQPANDVPVLSRRMRFPIRPKLASQSKDESQSSSVGEKTSEETLTTSNEITSVVKTSVLSRRSRFQIQPKPSGKTLKQSSLAVVNNINMSSTSSFDNELTSKSSQDVTTSMETEDSKQKEESGNHFAHKDTEDTVKELPSKSEQTSLPTLSRRSRFQVQPKVRNSQTKDKQPDVPVNKEEVKISNENTNKRKTTTSSDGDHFEIPSKTKVDAEDQSSSTSSTKPPVSESPSISTSATSTLASGDDKLKDDSQINLANKNDDDATTITIDKELTTEPAKMAVLPRRNRFQIQPSTKTSQPSNFPSPSDNGLTPESSQDNTPTSETNKEDTGDTAKELPPKSEPTSVPTLSRRSRFQVQPKVRHSQSKDKKPDVPVDEQKAKTSDEDTSKSESAILPRRNRFQVKPKPGAKSTEPSSSVAASTKVGTNESVTTKDVPLTSVEMDTSDSDNKQTVDSGQNDEHLSSTDAVPKIESAILPRRNRFQVKPKPGAKSTEPSSSVAASTKVGTNESVTTKDIPLMSVEMVTSDSDNKQTVDSGKNDEHLASTDAAPKIESAILPRRNRFQVKPKPDAKSMEPSSSVAASTKVGTNESVTTKDIPLTSVEMVTSDSDNKQTVDSGKNDEHLASTDAAPKIESAILPRRNRFQVKPKPDAKSMEPSSSVAASTKVGTNESVTTKDIPLTSVEMVTSDSDNKQTVDSCKNDEHLASTDAAPKIESAILPRRNRFQVKPKPDAKSMEPSSSVAASTKVGTNESVTTKDIPLTSVEMVTSDSDNKQTVDSGKNDEHLASTDAAPKIESAILPRRNRFQVKPKPDAKSMEPSSSVAASTKVGTNESVTTKDIPLTSVEMVTSDSDNKQTVDSGKNDEHLASTDAAPKIESAILPRRNRFQVKPKPDAKSMEPSSSVAASTKVGTNESVTTKDIPLTSVEMVTSDSDKQTVDSGKNDEHLASTDAAPKINRFQVKPKPGAKLTELSSSVAASTKIGSNESVTKKDIPLTFVEKVMSDSDNKQTVDSGNNDENATSTDAAPKIESAILPRRNRFQVKPKPGAKSTEPSSSVAASTKFGANESVTKKDMSVEKVTSDSDNKQTIDSDNNYENSTSTDAAQKVDSGILPRRNRFQVKPKPGAKSTEPSPSVAASIKVGTNESVTKKDISLMSVEKITSDSGNNDEDATSTDAAPKIESAILPRRNRFQVKPKPGAKSTEPSSSVAASTKIGSNESVTKKDIPLMSVEKVTSDSDNKQTVDSGNNGEDATSTDAAPKIESTILPRRNRFQVKPKPGAKSTESSSSAAVSTKFGSNESITKKDIPLTSVEKVTPDSDKKQTADSGNNDEDATSTDAAPKIEKTPALTLSRRSRFQVRPKLGTSKDLPKIPSNSNETKEKRVEKTPSKSASSIVSVSANDNQRKEEEGQAASPQKNMIQNEQIRSESSKSPEKSLADSSVQSPVKSTGKNSSSSNLSSPLKDNIQIENIKQREYPVNVHKSSGKSSKSLPLREKQKKPDVSVHPSDKPPDKGKMKMRDLIYWNPSSNPMKSPDAKRARPVRQSEESPTKPIEQTSDENEPIAVPQVKIGADGNIVLNEESLVINNSQPTAPVTMEVVDETDVYSNYGSFRRYTPKSKWSLKETKKFFLALSSVGTDFSLMTNLFTKKSRRDLKNKFKREERNNRWLVDKAIRQQLHFDEKLFEEMSESDEEDVEPPTKKSRQKKDSSESLNKKEKKSGKSKKDSAIDSSATAKKSKQKMTESEEGEPPTKKSRKKKDSSESPKTKGKKPKASKTDSPSTSKKTKKSKQMSSKDWVIDSQEDTPGLSEGIVEEEPVMNEMLIIPENAPFAEDTLTRPEPRVPRSQSQEEEVVNILIEMGQNAGRDSRAQQSSQVPPSVSQNKHPATPMPTVNTHSTPITVTSNKPGASNRAKSIRKVRQNVSVPGSSGSSHVATNSVATSEEARDNGSLARLFLQQMGLNSQLNALQDEIVSITEAEISNNEQIQKVILVEVQPKDQKQTVVHMYLVSRHDSTQPCSDGSAGGQVTVSAAQPLTLHPTMSNLSDTPPTPNLTDTPAIDLSIVNKIKAPTPDTATSPSS